MTVTLETLQEKKRMDVKALLDSGATGMFIDKKFAEEKGLKLRKLDYPVQVFNTDGTRNLGGAITHKVTMVMRYKGHCELAVFEVCDLGKTNLIIGHTWLKCHNPTIDWITGEVTLDKCPRDCGMRQVRFNKPKWGGRLVEGIMEKDLESIEEVYRLIKSLKAEEKTTKKSPRELVPSVYHRYLTVFEEKDSERMPIQKPWDHAIDLKEGFEPKKAKVYPLSPEEQKEVAAFVEDQLAKGYIRPSKSPQTSPVFFVPKKDDKKRMVQDY